MKLYNKTKVAPDILDAVLVAAGRCTKARTTGVVVKVTQGHRACSSGYGNQLIALRKSALSDTEIVSRWKQFLADSPPKSKQWKGALFRFMESLRS